LSSICIPSSVEFLGSLCFSQCSSLSWLIFESDSKLAQIDACVFSGCRALKSICIPASIRSLAFLWHDKSSLVRVTFESAASLQTMIEGKRIDLSGKFDIYVVGRDRVLGWSDEFSVLFSRRCFRYG
jgi:hypothetical protein